MSKNILTQVFSYGITTVLVRVFPFLLTFLLTRIYSPNQYSLFVEFYAFAGIFNAIITHGMETGFFKFIVDKKYNKQEVYSTAFISILIISVLFLILILSYTDSFLAYFKPNNKYYETFIIWFVFILIFDALSVIPFSNLRVEEKIFKFSVLKIISPVLYFFISILLVYLIPLGIKNNLPLFNYIIPYYNNQIGIGYVFIANLISSFLTFILLLPDIFKISFKFSLFVWKKIFIYSLPIMIAGIGAIINETMDKIFLRYLLPNNIAEYQVGIYGACYKISTFMILFKQAYLLGIEPYFFKNAAKENAKQSYASLMYFFVVINCVMMLGLITNIEIIKKIMLAKQYWVGLDIVPLVLFGTLFLGIYLNLSVWYKVTNKTYYGALLTLVGVIITIAINFIYIPIYGYWASAWATLLSYFCMMVLSYIIGHKSYPIPYQLRKIIIHIIISIVMSLISFYLFNQNLMIGNLILIMYIALIFIFDKNISLKNFKFNEN